MRRSVSRQSRMPRNPQKYVIYAVSDATGELAHSLAFAAARQFEKNTAILRRPRTRTRERIDKVIHEAHQGGGLIVFTLVSPELRNYLLQEAVRAKVNVVDVMGPLMENFAKYLHANPSDQPGMQYQLTADYFRRNEAVEFTVKHDDSLGLDTLAQADIILLGISRTSKTPLSIYLSYRGFKVANIPIVKGVEVPVEVREADVRKLVGLTISADKLAELRQSRLTRLGKSISEAYADLETVRQELSHAQRIFAGLGNIPVIDVTGKAIEEAATEILLVLGK